MRVQLIVVQGKPAGKVIPLGVPVFKIGRGETCHLRPNSELVSREHAEFRVRSHELTVRDLESRNGTFVNGKAITTACSLNDRDLVQVGPLTFMVSIEAIASTGPLPPNTVPVIVSPSTVETPEMGADAWPLPKSVDLAREDRSSDTIVRSAFQDVSTSFKTTPQVVIGDEDDTAYERLSVMDGETKQDIPTIQPERARPPFKRSTGGEHRVSNAAAEILRKVMEHGRANQGPAVRKP